MLGFSFGASLILLVKGCASTGYPTGGPRDEEPPYVVRSVPAENSLSFLGDEVRIEFNEIIQVSDIFQKLMVSPPVNKQPVVSSRGKMLIVKFEEDLQLNATYTLDFADAIRDNNEGNILENFTFSFSTGEYIDSLAISGNLYNASDLSPVANALVMVHSNKADSAFRTQVPLRVTRSNSTGRFSIQNLAPGEYRLFALEDANRNYKYDQPGERIAWHSELVSPHIGFHERVDSVGVDSTVVVQVQAFLPDSLQLFMFQEDNIAQYLADFRRPLRNKVDLVFSRPLLEPLEVEIVNKENFDKSAIYESSARHDSVSLWLKDSLHIKSDSLFLHLKYPVLDSLKQLTWKNDTINAYFFDTNIEAREGRGRRREEEALPEAPSLKIEGLKANVEILEAVAIQFASPIENINRDRLRLFQIIDTIPKAIDFDVVQDSLRLRRYSIEFSRVAAGKYSLEIDSAAFTDIYGLSNNALKQNISIRAEDEYATFYIEIVEPDSNWLLEVLDRQEKVVRSLKVPRNGKMGFRYIRPGDYIIRIVDDKNNNGEWDTGDFESGVQPESIYYYPETVSVRANWDHIINWEPKLFDIYDFVQRMRSKQSSSAARRP